MPVLTVTMLKGRTAKKKAELTADLTSTVSRVLNIDSDRISCLIEEIAPENWARGGITMAQQVPAANSDEELAR